MSVSLEAVSNETPKKPLSESSAGRRWPVPPLSFAIIMALGLGMRLLALKSFFSNRGRFWLFSHPYEMGLVANSLIHGHGYGSPFGGSTGPSAIVAPGYPTLVAAVFLVFGSDTYASALAIIGLQILVGLVTIWLMMHVARELFDQRTALVAGAFWAVSLPLLWIPTIFWETSISACAFVVMVALAIRCGRTPTLAMWILLGATGGVAGLINPALLPSLAAMMIWVAWETRREARTAAIIGLLTLTLVYAPWPIRNAIRFHAFIPMRSTVGLEMYMGNHPGADGRLDESTLPMTNPKEFANFIAAGEIAYTHNRSMEASAYIRAHPLVFFKLSVRRAYRFWTGTGNADGSPFYAVHAVLTAVFGFAGVVLAYRRRMRGYAVLFALPLLLFPFPYYITHAEFRYRLNIDALLTIPAAYAVTQLAAAWTRRKGAKQAVPTAKPTVAG